MVDKVVHDELVKTLEQMPLSLQRQVLAFASSLHSRKLPPGTSGHDLLKFAGTISSEDCLLMEQAIEEGCEQIDIHGW